MWFGDLVTMEWWDDIWLNEGFASWMGQKALDAWKPEWKTRLHDVAGMRVPMTTDSLAATRKIRQQAATPAEIDELFDSIAYTKTAAVHSMIESYVGEEAFRKGINTYFDRHAWGTRLTTISPTPSPPRPASRSTGFFPASSNSRACRWSP